jgi:hypothetical protein
MLNWDHFCGLVRLVLNSSALRLCTGTAMGPVATGGALPVVKSVVSVKLALVLVWVLNFLHQVPKQLVIVIKSSGCGCCDSGDIPQHEI